MTVAFGPLLGGACFCAAGAWTANARRAEKARIPVRIKVEAFTYLEYAWEDESSLLEEREIREADPGFHPSLSTSLSRKSLYEVRRRVPRLRRSRHFAIYFPALAGWAYVWCRPSGRELVE